jgi:hypothetical protein
MSVTFAQPAAPSAGVQWADLHGSLLALDVKAVEDNIKTAYGEASAVRVDLDVIDGKGAGEHYADALVFPKVLAAQLRSRVGQKILGRLAQGNAKPGQSAPWILDPVNDADIALGEAWVAAKKPSFSSVGSDDKPPY